jgi:hypothetical protein
MSASCLAVKRSLTFGENLRWKRPGADQAEETLKDPSMNMVDRTLSAPFRDCQLLIATSIKIANVRGPTVRTGKAAPTGRDFLNEQQIEF